MEFTIISYGNVRTIFDEFLLPFYSMLNVYLSEMDFVVPLFIASDNVILFLCMVTFCMRE